MVAEYPKILIKLIEQVPLISLDNTECQPGVGPHDHKQGVHDKYQNLPNVVKRTFQSINIMRPTDQENQVTKNLCFQISKTIFSCCYIIQKVSPVRWKWSVQSIFDHLHGCWSWINSFLYVEKIFLWNLKENSEWRLIIQFWFWQSYRDFHRTYILTILHETDFLDTWITAIKWIKELRWKLIKETITQL